MSDSNDMGALTPASNISQTSACSTTPLAKRRPIPRKGHTKSRAGCLVCKRRKVKCDEVKPECGPCQRLGLNCQFLNRQQLVASSASTSLVRQPSTASPMFDRDDMMFFRHFLFDAYPPLPIDGFAVWQEISKLSHEVSPSRVSTCEKRADRHAV